MQFSLAQHAAEPFLAFFDGSPLEGINGPRLESQSNLGDRVDNNIHNLEYVSDWLHLWLLFGDAATVSLGNFSVYLQAVAIILADTHSSLYQERIRRGGLKGVFPPAASEFTPDDALDEWITSQPHEIPSVILPEMYAYCASMDDDQRVTHIIWFCEQPAKFRTNFAKSH